MLLYIGLIAVQVACIVDVVRNGRNRIWIMALMFLPVASTIAYLIVEVYPRFQADHRVRAARQQLVDKIDPERDIRAARDALDLAPTTANRIRLGDAMMERGRHAEAERLFSEAVGMTTPDHRLGTKLARAQYLADKPEKALATLDTMTLPKARADQDGIDLLRARILEDIGREEEAASYYAALVGRFPGDEVRCRYAALLIKQHKRADAHKLLTEVEQRLKRMPKQQRAADGPMYDWAMAELARLRG